LVQEKFRVVNLVIALIVASVRRCKAVVWRDCEARGSGGVRTLTELEKMNLLSYKLQELTDW